jgi:cysteine-rich repeat protein
LEILRNMRTPLIAVLIAALVPACMDGLTGVGDDDDTMGGPNCGNGTMDTDESCDDGNTTSGDGCSASCQTETVATPRAVLSVDKSTVTSDLGVDQTIVVTATSAMGFAGDVTLSLEATNGTAATDWYKAVAQTTLTVPADGSATTMLTIRAMGDTPDLSGMVKITGSGDAVATNVSVTFNPVLRVTFTDDGNGACAYSIAHNTVPTAWLIKAGRSIAVFNGATKPFTVHTDSSITGFPHQNDTTAVGAAYTKLLTAADELSGFYCHNPGDANTATMKEGIVGNRQQLKTVP